MEVGYHVAPHCSALLQMHYSSSRDNLDNLSVSQQLGFCPNFHINHKYTKWGCVLSKFDHQHMVYVYHHLALTGWMYGV